jgi:DNA-binding transcriptional ArsR family regulator
MQTRTDELKIHDREVKAAALIFRAINHRLRQTMLKLMHNHGSITVTELYRKLNLEQSVASQHLAILRKAGLVLTERDKRCIFYKVNYQTLAHIDEQKNKLLN